VLITHERDIAARAEHIIEMRDGDIWTPDGSALARTTR
jgi:predicted ABC-type transport system involved in lysophospholipase L1 biosynthesis ATPase subunit